MKATGIVRRLDDVGRVVLPIDLRRCLRLEVGSPLEIFMEGETLLLRRYEPLCVFCNHDLDLRNHEGKQVCRNCRSTLSS